MKEHDPETSRVCKGPLHVQMHMHVTVRFDPRGPAPEGKIPVTTCQRVFCVGSTAKNQVCLDLLRLSK